MHKSKYSLSSEGVDRLMDNLTKIAAEAADEAYIGLQETEVTTAFVKSVTQVKNLNDVINRNEELSRQFQGWLNMYGFTSMYDMYIYAQSCDLFPDQVHKSKDYSKLVPVKRKIIRNGKETEVTVYEDPNKDNKESNDSVNSREESSVRQVKHARELRGRVKDRKTDASPETIADLKKEVADFPDASKFQGDSEYYLELRGEGGTLEGIVGYSDDGEYFHMDFYISSGRVSGVATRGLGELLSLALTNQKGVKVEDQPEARPVLSKFGLEKDGSVWLVSNKDLQLYFGKSDKNHG